MAPPGKLRIIGGRWRGRRLPVAAVPGLRPTGDRLRETLFNWLAPWLDDARCLDLYAGTGALGFEALSRGAATATLVENDRRALATLQASRDLLGADRATIRSGRALDFLRQDSQTWDIVFVDPPFAAGAWEAVLEALVPRLADGAKVYVECPAQYSPGWPAAWREIKHRQAGAVACRLLEREPVQS